MQFGLIVANQNKKKTRIGTFHILRMLNTGCSTKEAISLLLPRSTYDLCKNDFCKSVLGKTWHKKKKRKKGKSKIRTLYTFKVQNIGCTTKQRNKTASVVEHVKFQEQKTFTEAFWVNCGK